ncbi:flagellar hook-basal body complex protein FliE [Aliifodinibius sp. S!AR15-10]|uniref:flagellar hook-basal body complex protein FliE n=1 Tax=Aliifodinibius sp. S!AR15-10 TaxID=2950437 RepID=UPI002867ADDE|nr:flagellar hook-basal body complex protein FliE [Aliifodinibius sp. S!AR15-10]MDR8394258.1 flagellar hook-basal body complex protein FliE [Aliifodinibius sp. S!AR15-10]
MPDSVELSGITPQQIGELASEPRELAPESSGSSFADMLSEAVNSVDQTMKESNQKVENFVAGKTENVHDVMISMQRAQLSFQLMVEMRNKAIETYQEVSRMQI